MKNLILDEMQMLRKGKASPDAKVTPATLLIATMNRIVTCNVVNQMRRNWGTNKRSRSVVIYFITVSPTLNIVKEMTSTLPFGTLIQSRPCK